MSGRARRASRSTSCRKVAQLIAERFDYRVSDDPSVSSPIGTYRLDDEQEFIR